MRQFLDARQSIECGALERTMLRVVAAKVTGVDGDAANNPGQAESNDAPVEPGRSSAAAFPTVHPFPAVGILPFDKNGRTGLQQIFLGRKKVVISEQHRSTEF